MHRATHERAYTRAWFDYCRSVFPESVRNAGPDVDLYNVSTYQRSILFNNIGSFNRKSEFRRLENMHKPVSPQERFNVTDDRQLSLLRQFLGNNYAHVILSAEADSLPTDEKNLLDDYGLVGYHPSRSNGLSVHAKIDSSGYVRLLWESDDDRKGHVAIFEVKFGKKTKRATTETRERTAEQLYDHFEFVALAVEGSDLGTTEDPFEPTARCITDTKKRQLVTRSGLARLRCCVSHLHHKCAMKPPDPVRECFKTVLQQVCHLEVDIIAGDANAGAYKYYKNQEYQYLYNSSVAVLLREMQREVNTAASASRSR